MATATADFTTVNGKTAKLSATISADGTLSFPLNISGRPITAFTVDARGTWGGGTLTLSVTSDETNYVTATDSGGAAISWTSNDLKQGMQRNYGPFMCGRLTLAGSTNPSLTVSIVGVLSERD